VQSRGDIPWSFGPRPVSATPSLWTRHREDDPPEREEHADFAAELARTVDEALGGSDESVGVRVRGDWFGDRTEELVVDLPAFAEDPDALVSVIERVREMLATGRWRRWRVVVPLRDLAEGGVLALYADATFARRELGSDDLPLHVRRLVLRDAAEREGEEAVRRARRRKLAPLVRGALLPFLAGGEWARVLATEPGDSGYELVWVLHRFAAGEGLDDLDLEPESGYQDVLSLGDDGDFEDTYGAPDRERLRVVLWEVPTDRGRILSITIGERSLRLPF
jgi:hypothetical protein